MPTKRRVLLAGAAALVAYRIRQRGWRLVEHDLLDHPLMTLWPKVGDWLHDRDELIEDDEPEGYSELDFPRCIGCGCSDLRACEGGCSWAQLDPPVCSSCSARATVIEGEELYSILHLAEHGLTLDEVDVHQDLTAPLDTIRLVAVPKGTRLPLSGKLDIGVQRPAGDCGGAG